MKLILIDSKNLCFRTGWVHKSLHATNGTLTGVLHGFLTTMLRLKRHYPDAKFIAAWDSPHDKESWRFKLFPGYKDRGAGPVPDFVQDIQTQIPLVERVLGMLDVPQIKFKGVEADDIISVLARECLERDWRPMIYSNDYDYVQLYMLGAELIRDAEKGAGPVPITQKEIEQHFEVPLARVMHFRAVVGDKSDCIPGAIPGVGPVRARVLISAGLDPTRKLEEQSSLVRNMVSPYWADICRNYQLMQMLERSNEPRLGEGADDFDALISRTIKAAIREKAIDYQGLINLLGQLDMVTLLGSRHDLVKLQRIY